MFPQTLPKSGLITHSSTHALTLHLKIWNPKLNSSRNYFGR